VCANSQTPMATRAPNKTFAFVARVAVTPLHTATLTHTQTHTHTVAHTRAGKQQTRICEYSSATAKYVNARVQREIQSSRSFSSFLTKLRDEHLDRPKQNERGPTNERRFNSSSAGTHCAPHKSGQMC